MGSAFATALTQATMVAATKAAKRTRIGRSVGRGYLPPPIHVKLAANPAICPPLPVLALSIEPSISEQGQQRRDQIWAELTG